jgi:hypothetical protein
MFMNLINPKAPIPTWFKITWGYIIGAITDRIFRGLGISEIPSLILGGIIAVGFYFLLVFTIKKASNQ